MVNSEFMGSSLLPTRASQLTPHDSCLSIYHYQFTTHVSQLTTHASWFTIAHPPLTTDDW